MKVVVRTLSELGEDVVLAPERWISPAGSGDGVPLGDLVIERRERAEDLDRCVVLDTTHARDGWLDVHAALRAQPSVKSAKKIARAGDLVVSRLRPYLRQIALVHPRALALTNGRSLAFSSEFYVLTPRRPEDDIGFLLPFLLGDRAQAVLAAAQEGGHHPRVPRSSLLAMRVPSTLVQSGQRVSRDVDAKLASLHDAMNRFHELVEPR